LDADEAANAGSGYRCGCRSRLPLRLRLLLRLRLRLPLLLLRLPLRLPLRLRLRLRLPLRLRPRLPPQRRDARSTRAPRTSRHMSSPIPNAIAIPSSNSRYRYDPCFAGYGDVQKPERPLFS
jgi:hypothetical protein